MTKEQQDLAWKCLPSDMRQALRLMIKSEDYTSEQKWVIYILYGKDNLTSDIEPEEVLMVEKSKVVFLHDMVTEACCKCKNIDSYVSGVLQGKIEALNYLFGDKCLPDKEGVNLTKLNKMLDEALEKETPESMKEWLDSQEERPKPKFKIGDKVLINASDIYDEIGTIKDVIGENVYSYSLKEYRGWFHERQLEPFRIEINPNWKEILRKEYGVDPNLVTEEEYNRLTLNTPKAFVEGNKESMRLFYIWAALTRKNN